MVYDVLDRIVLAMVSSVTGSENMRLKRNVA